MSNRYRFPVALSPVPAAPGVEHVLLRKTRLGMARISTTTTTTTTTIMAA